MAKFSKYKIGVTNFHAPTQTFSQNNPETGKSTIVTEKDLIDAGVPAEEIARHIELGTIVGLEGSEVEEPKKTEGKADPQK